MNDFWKSYDITHAEYGADYRCYPLYGTVHLMEQIGRASCRERV